MPGIADLHSIKHREGKNILQRWHTTIQKGEIVQVAKYMDELGNEFECDEPKRSPKQQPCQRFRLKGQPATHRDSDLEAYYAIASLLRSGKAQVVTPTPVAQASINLWEIIFVAIFSLLTILTFIWVGVLIGRARSAPTGAVKIERTPSPKLAPTP